MAKNERFHMRYIVDAKGISTNKFVPTMLERMLRAQVAMINRMYQQTDAKLTVKDIHETYTGNKNARKG